MLVYEEDNWLTTQLLLSSIYNSSSHQTAYHKVGGIMSLGFVLAVPLFLGKLDINLPYNATNNSYHYQFFIFADNFASRKRAQ